jgi:hypothetical protein
LRINILIAGGLILAVSVLLVFSEIISSIFGFVLGGLNVLIGVSTRKVAGVTVPADPQGPLKLSIDKGVIRASIYTVAFSERKLVLRKLSSANLTVVAALILAILGAFLAGPFGILVGGTTAFSLQEFVTQRRRDEIERGDLLDASGRSDLEFRYDEVERVELIRNRIQLHLKNRVVRIGISGKYWPIIGPLIERTIPARIRSEAVPSEKAP